MSSPPAPRVKWFKRMKNVARRAWQNKKWIIPFVLAGSPFLFKQNKSIQIEPARSAYSHVTAYREKNMLLYPRQPREIDLKNPVWKGFSVTREIEATYFAPGNIVRVTLENGQQTYFLVLPASESTTFYLHNPSFDGALNDLIKGMRKQKNPVVEMESFGITHN